MCEQESSTQQDVVEVEADLDVSEEQAAEVVGGLARVKFGADRDPQGAKIRL